jgi:hypothetical protein
MTVTSTALFRGAASTSNTTLYTVPASQKAVVTNIAVGNTTATERTFTLKLDDIDLITDASIAGNSIATFDMKQVLDQNKTIKGSSTAVTVNFHISGVVIS